jgi:hypothetical protein
MFGTSGTGYFEFQPIQLKNKITSTNYLTVFPLQCRPNPATQLLTLDRNYNKVIIFNNQGQQCTKEAETASTYPDFKMEYTSFLQQEKEGYIKRNL